MAVNVKSCYLFLLDNVNQTFMPTERPLDETVDGAYYFIEKNIEKCIKNQAGRPATFRKDSQLKRSFLEYRSRSISFLDFAREVAIKRYDFKDAYEIFNTSDLFICEIEIKEVEYIVGLELKCKEEMIHHVNQAEMGVQNNVINHGAIISSANLSNANFFMIELDKLDITILEKMVSTVDDDTYLYADKILECDTKVSIKEAIKTARIAANEVIEKNKLNKLEVVPLFERVLRETINEGEDVNLEEIANEVFFPKLDLKDEFLLEVESQGVKEPITNKNRIKIPKKKTQKLKTDIGIEIIVPLDYYNNKDYIEVINTTGGRAVIQIKNIGNIENQ